MLAHIGITLMLIACAFNTFRPSVGQNLILLIKCKNRTVHFQYSPPLPAASANSPITESFEDSGTLMSCQVLGLNINVKYYLSVTLTQANCQQAIFSTLIFRGNLDVALNLPKILFNFTIGLSDPVDSRELNKPQTFYGHLAVPPGVTTPPPANITFTFPNAQYHEDGCQNVTSEEVLVDAYLYTVQLPTL